MEEALRWVPIAIWTLALAIPLFFILRRIGKSYWWLLIALAPIFGGTVLLWIIAFSKWPAVPAQTEGVS